MIANNSKARIDANNRYNKKTYDQLRCNYRKEYRLNELVELAANFAKISKAEYIITAIRNQLNADGITIDMLPDVSEESEEK